MRRSLFLSLTLAALAAEDSPTTPPVVSDPIQVLDVRATRLPNEQQTSATTVLTSDDLERQAGRSLTDLLRNQAGVQVRSLSGSRDDSSTAIDLRGFGETGAQNSLVIVDGRRINDLDLAGADLGIIPAEAIDRIEILRGGAGGVLYGDGAVGGVINIVTKAPPVNGSSGSFTGSVGNDGWRKASGRAAAAQGPVRAIVQGVIEHDDGWRANSASDRGDILGEVQVDAGALIFTARGGAGEQDQELSGARQVAPVNQLEDDPRGTSTPDDLGTTDTWFVGGGATWRVHPDLVLVVDGERRNKEQHAEIFGGTDDRTIRQTQVDPRLTAGMFGGTVTAGVDWISAELEQRSDFGFGVSTVSAEQQSTAAYVHLVAEPHPRWQVTAGLRAQQVAFTLDAPQTLDQDDDLVFADLDVAWWWNDTCRWYARGGHSNRVPTVDERGATALANYKLGVQTSWDAETGVALDSERASGRLGAYVTWLKDEIAYDPTAGSFGANVNLDPTRRAGIEAEGRLRPSEHIALDASATYVRSEFTAGSFEGEPVPLVAPWVLSGGATWDATEWLWLSGSTTWIDASRRGSDYQGDSPDIPGRTVLALKVGGSLDRLRWSAAVQHWLEDHPYDVGYYSSFSGAFNAYPYAPTTVSASVGMSF